MGKNRVVGLDLLKIIAMVLILAHHIIMYGIGQQKNLDIFTTKFLFVVEGFSVFAVNCYALISGYLCYNKKQNYKRIINLWIVVLFYSAVAVIVTFVFFRQSISVNKMVYSLLPIINNNYWYFTAYIVLFLFIPILNLAVYKISNKQLFFIIIGLITLFCIFDFLSKYINGDVDFFHIKNGYSAIWLIVLYFIGAFINKNITNIRLNYNKYIYLLIFSATVFLTMIFKNWLMSYSSITVTFGSIMLFVFFLKSNIKFKGFSYLAKSAFSVYLITDNPLIREVFIKDKMVFLTANSFVLNIIIFLVLLFGIYICASLIDIFRRYLFDKLYIDKLIDKVINKIVFVLNQIYHSLLKGEKYD